MVESPIDFVTFIAQIIFYAMHTGITVELHNLQHVLLYSGKFLKVQIFENKTFLAYIFKNQSDFH